ncbi:MAG: hypothetical protein H6623_03710 [Bdellovibrionaceae bacterium]|nr:hypothetical protein [Pseudobdellovibrionaceae bacterium]
MSFIVLPVLWYMLGSADEIKLQTDMSEVSAAITAKFFPENQQTPIYKVLTCMQKKFDGKALFKSEEAKRNVQLLAPFLELAFEREKMSKKERALFLSQAIVESGGFTHFSETKKLTADKGGSENRTTLQLAMDVLAKAANGDLLAGKAKAGAKHSSQFGQYRGRGMIQLTGCDNYLSALHYLNLKYRNQKPYWQPYWYASEEKQPPKETQVGHVCSDAQLNKIMEIYEKNSQHKMSLNLYDALEDPMRLGWAGATLHDKKLEQDITGEKFMMDIAMAYWKGRCGEGIESILKNPQKTTSSFCPKDRRKMDNDEIISRCTTQCVKGSQGSWKERNTYFKLAQECSQ